MKHLGDALHMIHAYDSCQYNGRTFNFFPKRYDTPDGRRYRVSVTELFLGDTPRFVEVETGILVNGLFMGCCVVGDLILLVAGGEFIESAARVEVEDGELSPQSIHVTNFTIRGNVDKMNVPFLFAVSERTAMLNLLDDDRVWTCRIELETLVVTLTQFKAPASGGLGCVPLPIRDREWLVAGALPYSNDISIIRLDDGLSFERVGQIPEKNGCGVALALVKGRFVVGFGGGECRTMWVMDLQTRKCSTVRQTGEWHPDSDFAFLVRQRGKLYVIGGFNTKAVDVIPLDTLRPLIEEDEVREAFPRPEQRRKHGDARGGSSQRRE